MRKWMIGTILTVAFACGIFFYTEWNTQRYVDSLPKPPIVEQTVDTHSHPHPHPHDAPVPATSSNTVVFESETVAEENTVTAEQVSSEDSTLHVDTKWHIEDVSQSDVTWQTDDEHVHQSTENPFGQKLTDPTEMDPDELADMLREGLLQRFGDIPEVHTFIDLKRKKFKNQSLTLDEHIDYTTAQLHLWPHPETKKTLEIFLEKRASEYPKSTQIVR